MRAYSGLCVLLGNYIHTMHSYHINIPVRDETRGNLIHTLNYVSRSLLSFHSLSLSFFLNHSFFRTLKHRSSRWHSARDGTRREPPVLALRMGPEQVREGKESATEGRIKKEKKRERIAAAEREVLSYVLGVRTTVNLSRLRM